MGASDYMTGNAPAGANYAAPLLDFSPLAKLPEEYFAGQQRARATRMQNAFPNGVPTDPKTGQPDVNAIINTGAKLGGLDYVSNLLPYMYGMQIGERNASAIQDTISPGAPNPSAAGPGNLKPQPQAAQPQQQPQLSSAGTDNSGQPTIRSMATELFAGRDVSPMIPRFASAVGVNPDAPLNPQQAARAKSLMSPRVAQVVGRGRPDAAIEQNPNPVGSTEESINGPNARPSQVAGAGPVTGANGINAPGGGGVSGAPGPIATPPARVAQAPTAAPSAQAPNPARGLVPEGYDPNAFATRLTEAAAALRARAARFAGVPGGVGANQAKVLQEQAQAYDERAKQIFDVLGKGAEPTNEQKNLASGADVGIEANKLDVQRGAKMMSGIEAQASQYERDMKPYLDLSRSILNDPNNYTGIGAGARLNWEKIKTAFGGDPRTAAMMEGLQKVTATSVLGQINMQRDQIMEAGGSGGRIFAQQVDLVEKAAPQLQNTPTGNRFLVEVASRMGELNTAIRNMALDYKQSHRYLDAGFERQVADYLKSHAIFSKQELSHPELLGAPTIPPAARSKQEIGQWAHAMGLNPGDAIRTPDGRYVPASAFIGAPAGAAH